MERITAVSYTHLDVYKRQELEICFAKVWDGADANTELRSLSEQIKTQAAGETYTEEVLEDPQVELLPDTGYEESSE